MCKVVLIVAHDKSCRISLRIKGSESQWALVIINYNANLGPLIREGGGVAGRAGGCSEGL